MPTVNSQSPSANRYLFSGGGTGGGVYPAIAIVNALTAQDSSAEVLWIGSKSGVETDLVPRAGIAYEGVSGGPVVGVGLRAIPNLFKLLAGTIQAFGIVGRFKPRACLITGGWATIAPALACWLRGVPVVIYLPDVEPAAAINALSALAKRVAVTTEASTAFFRPDKAVVTGYPLRADLLDAAGYSPAGDPLPDRDAHLADVRAQARERFSLVDDLPVLLVFGGSRGARSINNALLANLPDILQMAQVIHISGTLDAADVKARAEQALGGIDSAAADRYHGVEYLHGADMALALSAADLVVSRAGASTMGEFPLFDLPAILVPYPYAWRYQRTNADYLETQGAAVRLDDDQLSDHLAPLVRQILGDDAGRRQMSIASADLKRPDAAWRIAALLAGNASVVLPADDIIAAHRHSIRHRDEILASETCGCFYCVSIFEPDDIQSWIEEGKDGQTAQCPFCGIDSVIGSASGFPITPEFLSKMEEYWFGIRQK